MLHGVSVILVRPRFPENIGMAARAMSNMGVTDLLLVAPERWEYDKALPLATEQGRAILDTVRVFPSLTQALAPFTLAIGTTARTGGYRQTLLLPEEAAHTARGVVRQGGTVALVFGPEDTGLENSETTECSSLVTIPTAVAHSSLNLAQAVLILLYECGRADRALPFADATGKNWTRPLHTEDSRKITLAEEQHLLNSLEESLVSIGHLPVENSTWFMRPMRRFLRKHTVRRHEFDMIMGICRQMRRTKLQGEP